MTESFSENNLPHIDEVIVVEGRDDTNAIKRAVSAVTLETHGFGISEETWKKLDHAYRERGLIIFTDPDHAGKEIRRRLKERYPEAKEAFLTVKKAGKKKNTPGTKFEYQDIGIENASPEDIREALSKARGEGNTPGDSETPRETGLSPEPLYTIKDLEAMNLVGGPKSKELRESFGDILGIGYYNAKGLLRVLNGMRISKREFREAAEKIKSQLEDK